MLSIGKLAAGQAKYYLDQAEGRVDVVDSVGDGLEDYYVGGSEARGEWLGRGSATLGLDGAVVGDELRAVLGGLDPGSDQPLRGSSSPVRVAGFDLTFSAPKSVSVMFGIGEPGVRDAVRQAHDHAVREAVGYLEWSAAFVRRDHGGAVLEPAGGLVAAAFRHRTSRAGDPQLHTHVLVANLGRGEDGRWSALDGRRIYAHARPASFIYQAVLRADLTQALGVEWGPVRQGVAELDGIPSRMLRAFSRRRVEIEAALAERGTSGPRAAEAAALATRRPKDRRLAQEELVADWRHRAADLGLTREYLGSLLGRRRRALGKPEWERAMDSLAGPLGLTHKRSTFTRREVIQGLCERVPPGARVDAAGLEAHADAFLRSDRTVALIGTPDDEDPGVRFRRCDGRLMPAIREELRYSTPELLALEQRVVDHAVASRRRGVAIASHRAVEAAEAARPTLTGEQRTMVRRLCLDGDGVAVVVGNAGTGKTYALATAREAWQAAGIPVLGVAVARRAAHELEKGSGIASTSVAALLADLRRSENARLRDGCVLVVDEGGMVATRQLAVLVDAVDQADGKLVLVGDHRQLPELEAGGGFRGLVSRELAIVLTENRRQVHSWERRALEQLRQGDPEDALAAYDARDRLVFGGRYEDVRDRLVSDWRAAGDVDGALMIAYRRADVAALNERAREVMRRDGALGSTEMRPPGGGFAVGDRVVVKRNDARLDVSNGERGRVVGVEPDTGRLHADFSGRLVVLDAEFLHGRTRDGDPTLVHGYAVTGHVAQGVTVDRAYVLAAEGLYREWIYTAMSRGREANHLYVPATELNARAEFAPASTDQRTPLDRLAAALRAEAGTSMAIDIGSARPGKERVRGWARWLAPSRLANHEDEIVDQAGRLRAERDHAARPEPPERASPPWHDAAHDRRAERRLARGVDRDIGRSL